MRGSHLLGVLGTRVDPVWHTDLITSVHSQTPAGLDGRVLPCRHAHCGRSQKVPPVTTADSGRSPKRDENLRVCGLHLMSKRDTHTHTHTERGVLSRRRRGCVGLEGAHDGRLGLLIPSQGPLGSSCGRVSSPLLQLTRSLTAGGFSASAAGSGFRRGCRYSRRLRGRGLAPESLSATFGNRDVPVLTVTVPPVPRPLPHPEPHTCVM